MAACKAISHKLLYRPFVLAAGRSTQVCKGTYAPEINDIDQYLAAVLSLEIEYESAYREEMHR
jgi:hypothetical protein